MSSIVEGARGDAGERVELRVIVSGRRGDTDLIVTGSSSDRLKTLVDAAAIELEETPGEGVWCERRGHRLDLDTPLQEAGIRWGDRLLLSPPTSEPTHIGGPSLVELTVVSGPCAGERFELGEGKYLLGRETQADIVIHDPSLSRLHLEVLVDARGVSVADAGSSNGTAVNGEPLVPKKLATVRQHDELELGRSVVRFVAQRAGTHAGPARADGRVALNRPPRVMPARQVYRHELKEPPSRARKARLPLAASLLPLAAGVLLFLFLKSPVMLAVAALTPLMAVGSFFGERRGGKKSYTLEAARFRADLERELAALDSALATEARGRKDDAPDAGALIARAQELGPTLWERRPGDADFMHLRLGLADLPARSGLTIRDGGEPELSEGAQAALAARRTLRSVPLTVDAAGAGVVGLAGPPKSVSALVRWLLLQAVLLHSPGELVVMAALTPTSAKAWSWIKWLPHLRPDRIGLDSDPIVLGTAPAERLLADVRELAAGRRAQSRTGSLGSGVRPAQLLLLLDEDTAPDRSLVESTVMEIEGQGVTMLWLGRTPRDVPGRSGAIVELDPERAVLSLTVVGTGEVVEEASAEGVSGELAERTARKLAPVRDAGELARTGDIPKQVGLLRLLDLTPPTPTALVERWASWGGALAATVGVGADGPLALDLRREGPHALIAGTTGSGKSELLRTLVASMASALPPNRLSFLLVDYKGGAAFAPCAALPHVVDVVSDLDEHVAERALVSLNAELKRRERILADHGADNLIELERVAPQACPPNLVIAVDEFAKLREEVPEFVDGVVDIAQRGRTLGVHMVLAAQTLRNALTQAIRVNVNLRLALRVADESESEDVIQSPLAARIPSGEGSRGRAYVRTGHAELREFQTAYVSGSSAPGGERELEVIRFELAVREGSPSGPADHDGSRESDLVLLGSAACAAQAQMALPDLAPPWLPTLPSLLDLAALEHAPDRHEVAIGLLDLPRRQRQDPLQVDLADVGHVAVFGAGNSGKTTALTTLALALARQAAPEELSIYCLDAAGGGLAPLQALPHCAGVVAVDEAERVERLMRLLADAVEQRSRARGAGGAIPSGQQTVLLLDDLGSFVHHYDRPGLGSPFERLEQILAGGRAAGVHVVVTASRRGALPAALGAHFGQRLVLRMNSEEDMLAHGLDAKTVRGARLPPGRGFTQDSHEFQIAVPVKDGAIVPFGEAALRVPGKRWAGAMAIGVLPSAVERASLPGADGLDHVPIGVGDSDLAPASVDLSEMHVLVIGPYRSGRSTALATLARGIAEAFPDAERHLLAPRRSPLRELELWSSTASSAQECEQAATALVARHDAGELGGAPAFLFVDDGGELTSALVLTRLEQLVRAGRDSQLRVIAAVETGGARGIGTAWIRELRREGHGLLLMPDLATDGDLLGAPLPRRVSSRLSPGRGFLVVRGLAELIQVAS